MTSHIFVVIPPLTCFHALCLVYLCQKHVFPSPYLGVFINEETVPYFSSLAKNPFQPHTTNCEEVQSKINPTSLPTNQMNHLATWLPHSSGNGYYTIMATFVILRHPVTILITDFTNPNSLTNDLLIFNSLIINQKLVSRGCNQFVDH